MAYVIVEFENQAGIAAVHSSWLTPLKKEVFWPPYKEQQRFDRALRCGEVADENSWKLYGIARIFHSTDDLLKARQKLKEAEVTSNLESEQEDTNGRQKRKPKVAKRLYDTSSDEEFEDQQLPRPPPVKKISIGSTYSSQSNKEYTNSQSAAESTESARTPVSTRINSSQLMVKDFESSHIVSSSPSFNSTTAHLHSTSPGPSSCQLTVTDKLVALISHVKEQNDQILAWIAKQNDSASNINVTFGLPDIPFSLPISTVEELNEFERYIDDNKEKFGALVSYLASLGGNTVANKTNRIFKSILSDTVTVQFNYYGQRSQKRAFSDLNLKNLILVAVKRSIPNSTDKEIEDVMKVWLKHAQERLKKKNAGKTQI